MSEKDISAKCGAVEDANCDPECKHLEPYGDEYDLTARCTKLDIELGWYDYWIKACETEDI
jgi:hypothetical protein